MDRSSVVAKNATVQLEGQREVEKEIEYFNLDAILAVGYRVKSKQGTQFRQWATSRLKDYLIQGYAVNQKRLDQLQKTIELIANNKDTNNLDEAKKVEKVVTIETAGCV